jgi:hypothetical protein
MSMPQYLEVAVVGKEEKLVKTITKGVPISQPGIAPKYHLVSLSPATHKRFTVIKSVIKGTLPFFMLKYFNAKTSKKCIRQHSPSHNPAR